LGVALLGSEFAAARETMATSAAWGWIALLGCTAVLSLPLYYAALHRMEVWRLRAWLLATPVLVAVAEWGLGLRLGWTQWLGAAMVLGGLAVLIRMELGATAGEAV
jgi:drug/metabolite transporter (DMT)-like permease